MQTIGKNFFLTTLFFLIVFLGLYLTAFHYQLGRHVNAEWWIKNVSQYKDYVTLYTKSPKIIIAGGSNALLVLNSSLLKKATGYDVVNLSIHAGLDITYLYYKIKEHLGKGDIVVMPLEFNYYSKDEITSWFSNNMMAWGEKEYLTKLTPFELASFILSVPGHRVMEGLFQKHRKPAPFLDSEQVIEELNFILISKGQKWRGYNFKSLNRYGDIHVEKATTQKVLNLQKHGQYYFNRKLIISDHFLSVYNKIANLVKEKQGKLIVTWPVTIRNKFLDMTKPEHQQKIADFQRRLEEKSINICCNPALFNLDVKFFYDTNYHTNKYGALIRSQNLAYCLNKMLRNKGCNNIGFNESIRLVRSKERQYARRVSALK